MARLKSCPPSFMAPNVLSALSSRPKQDHSFANDPAEWRNLLFGSNRPAPSRKGEPQGLKPLSMGAEIGTTEVVPSQLLPLNPFLLCHSDRNRIIRLRMILRSGGTCCSLSSPLFFTRSSWARARCSLAGKSRGIDGDRTAMSLNWKPVWNTCCFDGMLGKQNFNTYGR